MRPRQPPSWFRWPPGARRALERGHDQGGRDDGARYWLASAIELLLAELRFEEAETATNDYADRFDDLVRNPMDAPWRSHKAQALGHLGRRDEALELVADELELARAWRAPATIARTLRTLGTLERERGLRRDQPRGCRGAVGGAQDDRDAPRLTGIASLGSALAAICGRRCRNSEGDRRGDPRVRGLAGAAERAPAAGS